MDPSSSWSMVEVQLLAQAVEEHGRKWVKVAEVVGTKTNRQCRDKIRMEQVQHYSTI